MKLMTKELEALFKKTGSQEKNPDPLVIARFFNPTGVGNWYATEYDPTTEEFFGFVSIFNDDCDEWGYFSLAELQEFKGQFGLGIERNLYCEVKPMSEICPKAVRKTTSGQTP